MTLLDNLPEHSGRLELTWTDKGRRLLSFEDGSFQWADRGDFRVNEVRLLHNVTSVGVANEENRANDNLLIRGDALHALTSLAKIPEFSSEYLGQVRLAYIDPPFNTGQAFTQYDDNLEHSIWLTMMRDRLEQIHELLAVDGSVWLHLDDAEVHRARLVLDEVFGASNFIATVVWQKSDSPRNSARHLSTDQDYILIYAKDSNIWRPNRLARSAAIDAKYINPDNDHRGRWFGDNLRANKPYSRGKYTVTGPTGLQFTVPQGKYWRVSPEKFEELNSDGRIYWGRDQTAFPTIKRFLTEVGEQVPRTLWFHSETGSNRTSSAESKLLFPDQVPFATPKPEQLIARVIQIATNPGDIVLDCFAGSGTTPAVAAKLSRRWVAAEWSKSTVEHYTLPRLRKVVEGVDAGGVSSATVWEAEDELPLGVSVDEARATLASLRKIERSSQLSPAAREALTEVKDSLRIRQVTVENWTGGGGFRVLDVQASMFEEEDGQIFLAAWASGDHLAEAVAAQYNFDYEQETPFCGRRGNERLAVIDGLVNDAVVDFLLDWLPAGELLVVYGTGIDPYAQERLAQEHRGSSLEKIPEAIISNYRMVGRQRSGLSWASSFTNDAQEPIT
jgi:adenine-specific DNA-methyltransferase